MTQLRSACRRKTFRDVCRTTRTEVQIVVVVCTQRTDTYINAS